MVLTCFDAQPKVYKTPEQLESITSLFIQEFASRQIEDVRWAFQRWIRERDEMPGVSDILKIYETIQEHKARYRDGPPAKPLTIENHTKQVSWSCKPWNQFTEEDKQGLAQHLTTLTAEELTRYKKYLITMVGVPKGVLNV